MYFRRVPQEPLVWPGLALARDSYCERATTQSCSAEAVAIPSAPTRRLLNPSYWYFPECIGYSLIICKTFSLVVEVPGGGVHSRHMSI